MPRRILIAHDDAEERGAIRRFIELLTPCEVCGEAVDGLDAIEKAGALKPDLIILGYPMPMTRGTIHYMDVCALLGTMLPHVPVILFTGQQARAIESASNSAGIRAVVPKADLGQLAGHIENLLN